MHKDIYHKVFPLFLNLQHDPQPDVLQYVVRVLTAIVCENKEEYASRTNPQTGEVSWIARTKFTDEFLPAIKTITLIPNVQIQEAFIIAMHMIIENFPEAVVEISDFLKKLVHRNQSLQTRTMGISVLGKFAGTLSDPEMLRILVEFSRNKRSKDMRRRVLKVILDVVERFPPLLQLKPDQKHLLQYLVFALLRTSHLKDPIPQVRKYYIQTLFSYRHKLSPVRRNLPVPPPDRAGFRPHEFEHRN